MICCIFSVALGWTDAQTLCVGEVLLDVLFRHFLGGDTLLVGTLDDFVVHIGEVLDEGHIVAAVFKITAQDIKEDDGAGIAHMDEVVHRGAAGVDAHLARLDGDEFFLLTGHGIENLHTKNSFFMRSKFGRQDKENRLPPR